MYFNSDSPEVLVTFLFAALFFNRTFLNQQSELRPLISFMGVPSLISLSVLATSGVTYEEEVISFKSVCEREAVCDVHPHNLCRQERLKKSLLNIPDE